ncbi:protein-tyrosine-phosphatase [Leptospira sp. GIMC2001]|uniref:protein-tyrosine-phosphatase n=1 Tax=Leptospira sp. GIMC2001 TaxID=1513297 RepID=UPI0004A5C3E3|nr:protein-tyrosine-phosphatase [Leptospira sp. GIMC2001]AID56191.1 arsenate reductase [Leptospira sp. GIMC2001]WCL50299.1 protein-tyrosine-phosphatase [Leptospira sp. GIMC2001]
MKLYPELDNWVQTEILDSQSLAEDRIAILNKIKEYILSKKKEDTLVNLNFICTHNSRRSHISQILAYIASIYYEVNGIEFFSGGTEATAFNPRAISAFQNIGVNISTLDPKSPNPHYMIKATDNENIKPLIAFSKKYNDSPNPSESYLAIMTCDHAAENCPVVFGSDKKINLTYKDPKESDDTSDEKETYRNKLIEIGREMFYLMAP